MEGNFKARSGCSNRMSENTLYVRKLSDVNYLGRLASINLAGFFALISLLLFCGNYLLLFYKYLHGELACLCRGILNLATKLVKWSSIFVHNDWRFCVRVDRNYYRLIHLIVISHINQNNIAINNNQL